MNRHVVVNCAPGCPHRVTKIEAKRLKHLSVFGRMQLLHNAPEKEEPERTKPRTLRRSVGRRQTSQFA